MNFEDTLHDKAWLASNRKELLEVLPDQWTHWTNIDLLKIGFKLKLLGLDWRSKDDFIETMIILESVGILVSNGGGDIKRSTVH